MSFIRHFVNIAVASTLLVLLSSTISSAYAQRSAQTRGTPAQQSCTITRVTDGDTVHATCARPQRNQRIRIRLKGIDAPESRQAYGPAATRRLTALCLNQTVSIARRPQKDRYNRVLADLNCRGQDAGQYMVRAGLAWYYRSTARQYPRLVQLEAQAKRARLGLWAQSNPTPPWTWRQTRRD